MEISPKTAAIFLGAVIASATITYVVTDKQTNIKLFTRSESPATPASGATANAAPAAISNAPFGIPMGADPESLGAKKTAQATYFEIPAPPRTHPEFEKVVIQAAAGVGVCWVKGIGRDVATSDFGTEIRSHVDEIEGQLETKYGKPEATDALLPGSIWNEQRD